MKMVKIAPLNSETRPRCVIDPALSLSGVPWLGMVQRCSPVTRLRNDVPVEVRRLAESYGVCDPKSRPNPYDGTQKRPSMQSRTCKISRNVDVTYIATRTHPTPSEPHHTPSRGDGYASQPRCGIVADQKPRPTNRPPERYKGTASGSGDMRGRQRSPARSSERLVLGHPCGD